MIAAALLMAAAGAQDDPWWVGRRVGGVALLAPDGGLPEESLDPLLRSRQGEALDPAAVRTDITTLFRVGRFAAVEARVEPWTEVDEQGELVEVALLSFLVWPAPRVDRVRVEGARDIPRRVVLDAADVTVGQAWFADVDKAPAEARVRAALAARGYADAAVWVGSWSPEADALEVVINVSEGEPSRLGRLAFGGDLPALFPDVEERDLVRIARRAGLREGRPFSGETVTDARDAVRDTLASMDAGLFGRRMGWLSARVTPVAAMAEDGWVVRLTIEAGPRLRLDVDGLGWFGESRAIDALGIDARTRVTRGFLDEADEAAVRWLGDRGWPRASVEVQRVATAETEETLVVRADRGPRGVLRQGRFPSWVGVRFEGNDAIDDATLMAVLDDGVDALRRDRCTPEGLEEGLGLARGWYASQGYPAASLTLREVLEEPRRGRIGRALWAPVRALNGRAPAVRLTPVVDIVEGPRVSLAEVTVRGAAEGVDAAAWRDTRDGLVGGPGSVAAVETLAAEVAAAHRAAGWLQAEARARVEPIDAQGTSVRGVVDVVTGPQILLRSIVVSGPRATRPALVRREVDLQLGQPLSETDLERVRTDLYDLAVFRSVTTELVGDGALRDLVLTVSEKPRWAFEAGAGLATDQGVRTFGRIGRRNLLGIAHRVELYGQVGLDWRTESLLDWVPDIRSPEWRLVAQYHAPRFPVRDQDAAVDVLVGERRVDRTWAMDRNGAGLSHTLRLGDDVRTVTSVRVEQRQLEEVDAGALLDGEPWVAILERDPSLPTLFRPQETASLVVVADGRNDPVLPTRGGLLSLSGELAPGLVRVDDLPTASFVKAVARANAYASLPFVTWHFAAEGGVIGSLDGQPAPLEDRFVLGGTASLRGFPRQSLGPRNLVPVPDIDWPDALAPVMEEAARDDAERWVPTGGDVLAAGTVEALVPLPVLGLSAWDGYALAVFADVGNVWLVGPGAADTDGLDLPILRLGAGVGLRASTPVGPLQFDVAVNPSTLSATGARGILLRDAFGEPAARVHLTLGAL